ncbi:sensorin-A-like [Physella acuta]|uniref:sensorin-A-like n=1 Tax=Physella acuta TaxID=109671 RepID=UPI0027DD046E|nr:sensorin-A-like [Physella acuta]
MSATTISHVITFLLVSVVTLCLLSQQVMAGPAGLEKRETLRSPRARYRVGGYMFGKRGGADMISTNLFDVISREMQTKQALEALLFKNPEMLSELLTILDKNDDGFVTLSELM